ncbi:MAG: FAD-dependent oxidoreductase, partial [Pseudomonadota bacterium]|nr:FAD-dependent oxidoreductase [Pseudomonadota bacterium]
VGITAARLLKDAGLSVAVVEARKVGQEVTGKSTAKITSQHNLAYGKLARAFGEDGARTYAEANEAAIRLMADLASRYAIDCDFEPKAAYTYARGEQHLEAVEREVEVTQRLGLPASFTRDPGLPFPVAGAIRFDNQAQFHPCKYLAGLAATIPGDGCHVFEQSRAIDWELTRVVTAGGTVTARAVIMATHLPLGQVGLFYAENYPHMHPVIAARVDPARAPDGMYISVDEPRHSVRTHRAHNGDIYLIVTGPSFKHGHVDEERQGFAEIERFAAEHFGAGAPDYRWTNEDYTPMDGAPFIGWSSSARNGYLVATGFNAWGITNGTVAGIILAALASGRDHQWASLFDASRVKPIAGAKEFAKQNLEVAKELVGGYVTTKPHSFDELAPGEAAVLKVSGENVAAFRDEQGRLHAVSAVCTHMGCLVGWNENDRTWDCPCHGSRYEISGEVIHGPTYKPLEKKAIG